VIYCELRPHEQLRPWVYCYWQLEGCDPGAQVIYPDGRPEIVFHYGDPFTLRGVAQPRALYVGQMLSAISVLPSGTSGAFGVRFTPAGAWAFLRFPQGETAGAIAGLDEVCGKFGRDLADDMHNAHSLIDRIAIIEHALRSKAPARPVALDLLASAIIDGRLSSRDAQAELGVGERQWQRLFQERAGIRPKLLERIGRFHRALLLGYEGYAWADIAARCNYADQAHLVRDFREFAGASPTRVDRDPFAPLAER
jgi:AraC-like DNA-binding protein